MRKQEPCLLLLSSVSIRAVGLPDVTFPSELAWHSVVSTILENAATSPAGCNAFQMSLLLVQLRAMLLSTTQLRMYIRLRPSTNGLKLKNVMYSVEYLGGFSQSLSLSLFRGFTVSITLHTGTLLKQIWPSSVKNAGLPELSGLHFFSFSHCTLKPLCLSESFVLMQQFLHWNVRVLNKSVSLVARLVFVYRLAGRVSPTLCKDWRHSQVLRGRVVSFLWPGFHPVCLECPWRDRKSVV